MNIAQRIMSAIAPPPGSKQAPMSIISVLRNGIGVQREWNADRAIREGYKLNGWVYAAVRYHSRVLAPVPLFAEIQNNLGAWERDDDHPISVMLREPTLGMHYSGSDLRERWIQHLYLAGNAINHMVMANSQPIEIWPWHPSRVQAVVNPATKWIGQYELTDEQGRGRKVPAEEVIHLQFNDPANLYWGMAPLQAAARVVDTDNDAVRWNRVSLQKHARKDLIFYPEEALSYEQWEDARKQAAEQVEGPDNAGGVLIASTPGKFESLNFSPREMDFIQSRNLSRTEILAVLDMKAVLLTGEGTFRNFEHAIKLQWTDVYIPLLDDLCQALTNELAPFFDGRGRVRTTDRNIRVHYDLSSVPALQQTYDDKLLQAERLQRLGLPLAAINARLELGFTDDEVALAESAAMRLARIETRHDTKAIKTAWHKRMDEYAQFEAVVKANVATLLHEDGDAAISAYMNGDDAVEAIRDRADEWETMLRASYVDIIGHYNRAKRLTFTEYTGRIPRERALAITDTTAERVDSIIRAGIEVGASPEDIATTLLGTFDEMEEWRADAIARTEVHSAAEFGRLLAANGPSKSWLSMRDSRVRDSHADIDGETVPLDGTFSNGLEYPGDPMGDPGETVNCRCVLEYTE